MTENNMDIHQTKYFIQDYVTEKTCKGSFCASGQEFGFWQDENDSYDTYEEALEQLETSAAHVASLMRIVSRTITITTVEKVLYKHIPDIEE